MAEPDAAPPARDAGPELDEPTLALAQRGDPAAFRALVLRYQGRVFALLSRLLASRGRTALAEDLAQETFLKAHQALPGFRLAGPAKLSTWLLTIATRLAFDELRRRPPDPPAEAREPPRPDALLARGRLQQRLLQAVEALTPEQRAAFLLREAHGLSYGEIAEVLDEATAVVKARLFRARAALREALAGERDD